MQWATFVGGCDSLPSQQVHASMHAIQDFDSVPTESIVSVVEKLRSRTFATVSRRNRPSVSIPDHQALPLACEMAVILAESGRTVDYDQALRVIAAVGLLEPETSMLLANVRPAPDASFVGRIRELSERYGIDRRTLKSLGLVGDASAAALAQKWLDDLDAPR